MLEQYKKVLFIIVLTYTSGTIYSATQKYTYTINRKFSSNFKCAQFGSTTQISSSFPIVYPFPHIVIFIPNFPKLSDKARDSQQYTYSINIFLEHFSLPGVDKKQMVFFIMNQPSDAKSSIRKAQGEMLADFIDWLYSYNPKSKVTLISDRNGSAIVNYATHSGLEKNKDAHISTIIQLYPAIVSTATNELERALNVPHAGFYDNFYVVYSDHVNTFTTKKGDKQYPKTVTHTSYLPLKNNEQITPDDFLSSFCSQRLGIALQKAKQNFPSHKNFVIHWSTQKDQDQICFLKDLELFSPITRNQLPLVTQERALSVSIKNNLEKVLNAPVKTKLPLSDQSKPFYNSLSSQTTS